MSKGWIGGVLAGALLFASAAEAARPPAGARYRGTTSQGFTITMRVATHHRLFMRFRSSTRCRPKPDLIGTSLFRRDSPYVRADGMFDLRKTYHLGPVPFFNEPRVERQHLRGGFSGDASLVLGRLVETDVGRSGRTCRMNVTFSAHRVA